MLKEIKYLVFIVIISIFIFFTGRFYFSDENIKNSYRSYKNIDEKVKIYSKKLPLLTNDTDNIKFHFICFKKITKIFRS